MFKDIKVGEEVLARKSTGGFSARSFNLPMEVTHATGTRFKTSDGQQWRKEDGRIWGGRHGVHCYCKPYTKEADETAKYEDYRRATDVAGAVHSFGTSMRYSTVVDRVHEMSTEERNSLLGYISEISRILAPAVPGGSR